MNDIILQTYINKINKGHIIEYAKKEGIILTNNETEIIYEYIKKYWKRFYYENPTDLLSELKEKLSNTTYNKLENLYYEYKKIQK
ncbi:MAG: DUF2624 family protein [Bacilli bacterium]|nr:DUF2624 family protein [Bacilli bacterium]